MPKRTAHALIVGFLLTLVSAVCSQEFNWPDYYHIEYGLPVAWLVRTLSTIAGPTDKITFQSVQFILDFAFWSLVALLLLYAIGRVRKKASE
jgi:hypothetical protein